VVASDVSMNRTTLQAGALCASVGEKLPVVWGVGNLANRKLEDFPTHHSYRVGLKERNIETHK